MKQIISSIFGITFCGIAILMIATNFEPERLGVICVFGLTGGLFFERILKD